MDERAFASAQLFLLTTKLFWTRKIFAQVKNEYEAAGNSDDTVADVDRKLADNTTYRFFSWFERHLQQHKYSGPYGLVPYMEQRRDLLKGALAETDESPALRLNPELEMPAYYQAVDFHQHPGGVWSDEIAGFVYERGARTTTPTLGTRHADLHERFTALVCGAQKPARVLDVGCGFGKSTGPFAKTLPDSEVVGVDLSAPCLRLAAHNAVQSQVRNVRYLQADATATSQPAASYDLVTSTMLLHELPRDAIEGLFREARRVLKKGGRMVHLDFYHLPTAFDRFIHYGHGARNNEPFMAPLAAADLKELIEHNGFAEVEIVPFAESETPPPGWRFPWTVIAARKV